MGHFIEFLRLSAPDMPVDAVRGILREEWRRQLRAGQEALLADDMDVAVSCFRRCLELLPEDTSPNLQLGMALLQGGEAEQEAAIICFAAAEAGQLASGGDRSLAIYYRILTLSQLGRRGPARELADAYLAAPDPSASPQELERIRAASRALQQRR